MRCRGDWKKGIPLGNNFYMVGCGSITNAMVRGGILWVRADLGGNLAILHLCGDSTRDLSGYGFARHIHGRHLCRNCGEEIKIDVKARACFFASQMNDVLFDHEELQESLVLRKL